MAIKTIRIGSMEDVHQFDDGEYDAAIETDYYIKSTAVPIVGSDMVRLDDIGGVAGNVIGPAVSTDHAIVRFDGITGTLIQNSGIIVDDSDNLTLPDGAIFSSHNSDHTHLFSRASVGWIGKGNEAGFQHTSLALDGVSYALYQTNLGTTYLNCVTAKEINFCRNDVTLVTLTQLASLVDNSMVDTLHRHSELSASDGTPDAAVQVDAAGQVGIATLTPTISDGIGLHIAGKILRLDTSKTPATAADTGNVGEICWDADYIYVCVAANTWKCVAIATW